MEAFISATAKAIFWFEAMMAFSAPRRHTSYFSRRVGCRPSEVTVRSPERTSEATPPAAA